MIDFKSQTMRQVCTAMVECINRYDQADADECEDLINPDAPMIIQVGDFGYEVFSVGGDGDIEGFVIMAKPDKVCQWNGMEFKTLKGKK